MVQIVLIIGYLLNDSMGYSFSKGYYPRYADNKLNGRVTRLLVTPLIKSLIKLFGNNDYLEFIDSNNPDYQVSISEI